MCFKIGGFTSGDLFCWRYHDDVAVLAHVQAFRRHHDVECLVPRHIAQAQRNAALNRVGDDDVLARCLSQKLQYGACLDILEIQGQTLTVVFFSLGKQARLSRCCLGCRIDFDRKFVVRLICKLLILALRGNYDSRVRVCAQSIDCSHRRGEIHNVKSTHELGRQARVFEYCNDAAAFLPNINRR